MLQPAREIAHPLPPRRPVPVERGQRVDLDVRLLLRRDLALADIQYALGRREESGVILDKALAEANRTGLGGLAFEIRLAMVKAGRSPAAPLAAEARKAGFLLIARKAL